MTTNPAVQTAAPQTATPPTALVPAPASGTLVPANQYTPSGLMVADMPDYLQTEESGGLELLQQYIRPPFLKIVQPQSAGELKAKFREGDVITTPGQQLVTAVHKLADGRCSMDMLAASNPFYVTPLYFYPEFIAWNPRDPRVKLPAIRDRSLDPNSPVAKRARDFNNREMPCPELTDKMVRFCEHLNFVVNVWYNDAISEPHIMSFSRSEFKPGVKFNEKIVTRKRKIYAGVYQVVTAYRSNDQGQWYGYNVDNPSADSGVGPWVPSKEMYDWFAGMHDYFLGLHEAGQIQADYDDDNGGRFADATTVPAEHAGKF